MLLALAVLAAPASAHIAMWHDSMFGFEKSNNYSYTQAVPAEEWSFKDWWFHGYIDQPPDEGVFMELPSGGTFVGQVSCNKRHTTFGPGKEEPLEYACPEEEGRVGTEHSGATHFNANYWTKDPSAVIRGCGLAIAYESDEYKVKPEDFVVISIDHKCPWKREVPFPIPAGMPPCPPGGCLCMWSWIPQAENVQQSYYLNYRCNITNADANAAPLAKPQIARKCPYNKNNCTIGAKQALYFHQLEGNNYDQARIDPPYYDDQYGFHNGAQTDIWMTDDGTTWNTNSSDLAPGPRQTKSTHPEVTPYTGTQTIPAGTDGVAAAKTTVAGANVTSIPAANTNAASTTAAPATSALPTESHAAETTSAAPTPKCKNTRSRR